MVFQWKQGAHIKADAQQAAFFAQGWKPKAG